MYSLHCLDPRFPLGHEIESSNDLDALKVRCDQENAMALTKEEGFEQYWIVMQGRIVYPPKFVTQDMGA